MAAAPGCWAAFGALQAQETARFGYPPVHGLVVDAYAASHGGDGAQRRDRQSVCIHLLALCAVLERGASPTARIAVWAFWAPEHGRVRTTLDAVS
jgi:hypothetical protein